MKQIAFTVLLFILLYACFEYRVSLIEDRLFWLERLEYIQADCIKTLMEDKMK